MVCTKTGEFLTQGYPAQPSPALVTRYTSSGQLADSFNLREYPREYHTKQIIPFGDEGAVLVVGNTAIAVVAFDGACGALPSDADQAVTTRVPQFVPASEELPFSVRYRCSLTAHPQTISCADFSPDGSRIVTCGGARTAGANDRQNAFIRDANSGKIQHIIGSSHGAMISGKFSPDGSELATGDARGSVALWNPDTGEQLLQFDTGNVVHSLDWTPDGEYLVTSSGKGKCVEIWSRSGDRVLQMTGHSEPVRHAVVSPDGMTIASGSTDHRFILWNAIDGSKRFQNTSTPSSITALAFTPSGDDLVVGDYYGNIRIWNVHSGELSRDIRAVITENARQVNAVAVSPDGRILVSSEGLSQVVVRIWDLQSGAELGQIDTSSGIVYDVDFSPDGKTLALCCNPGVLKLFDFEYLDRPPSGQ